MLDHEVHDLARACPYQGKPHIAERSLDRINFGISHAAQNLHRIVYDVPCRLSSEPLGLANNPAFVCIIFINSPGSHIGNCPRRIELGNGIRNHEIHCLKFVNGLAKCSAPARVPYRKIKRAPDAKASCGRSQTLGDHHLIETECAAMEFSYQILLRHFYITEHQSPCTPAPAAEKAIVILCFYTKSFVNNEQTDAVIFVGFFVKISLTVHEKKV